VLACWFAPDFCLLLVNALESQYWQAGWFLLDAKSAWKVRVHPSASSVVFCVGALTKRANKKHHAPR